MQRRVDELADRAQYGWGHTMNFGPFEKVGVLQDGYLNIVGHLDKWGWWPTSLQGMRVADVGCCSGGITAFLAHRGAAEILAVEEIPEFAEQCRYVAELFELKQIKLLLTSLYQLPKYEVGPFDLILLSGVIYHLSDMLMGLLIMRDLLTVGGTLLIESGAVADDKRSYADFCRYAYGSWWRPTTLCLKDMCEFMGFSDVGVRMYRDGHALARMVKADNDEIRFKRGINYPFANLRDKELRTMDHSIMAPARRR